MAYNPQELLRQSYSSLMETYDRTGAVGMATAKKAGDLLWDTAMKNIDYIQSQSSQYNSLLAPYVQAGNQGNRYLQILLGMGDPGGSSGGVSTALGVTGTQAALEADKRTLSSYEKYLSDLKSGKTGYADSSTQQKMIDVYEQNIKDLTNKIAESENQIKQGMGNGISAPTTQNNQLFPGDAAAQQQAYINQIMNSPYVQSQIELGQKTVQGTAAAKGMLNSGRTVQQLFEVGMDIGSKEISKVQDTLLAMSQQGQQAAGALAAFQQANTQSVVDERRYGAEGKAGAMIKSADIYAQSQIAKAQVQSAAMMSGIDPFGNSGNPSKLFGFF